MKRQLAILAVTALFALGCGAAADTSPEPVAPEAEVEASAGKQCGPNVCAQGERCCSQQCGVCTSTNMCPLYCAEP
jgi:cytochrome c5